MKTFDNIRYCIKQLNTQTENQIARILTEKNLKISTTESCTGGLVSSRLTDVSGSSQFINENYVTYANEIKHKILNVSDETLKLKGAVSEECAIEMATGLLNKTGNDIALATTGIAGPTGGSKDKPVGLMYVCIKNKNNTVVKKIQLKSSYPRKYMKYMFSQKALELLIDFLKNTYNIT